MSNLKVSVLSTPQITYERSLIPKRRKAVFVGYPLESKGYKVCEVDAKRFTRCRDVVFHKNKFHAFDEVTNSTFFYKDNVDDETEPDDVRDELEIPTVPTTTITTTESPENLPSVGATYEDTFMLQVRNLGPTRQRKAPDRFHPEE